MGRFLTSQHILNAENLTKAQFKKIFVGALKKKGYVICDEDSAEISYTLVFPKDRKWVSVLNPEYEPGGGEALMEAGFFADTFKTNDISLALVDSDFAVLDLIDSTGKRVDTLILGESYMDDPSPTGEKNFWQPLLTENSTWEQVMKIQDGSYTFAEGALAEFAPLIGMDSQQILLDCEDVNDNAEVMYFKRSSKNLSLNAAFKQVFGKALEPLGFVKIKSKHPYFVRAVTDEIINVVTIKEEWSGYPGEKRFDIYSGIATVYRCKIDFDLSILDNKLWLETMSKFYCFTYKDTKGYNEDFRRSICEFSYIKNDNKSLLDSMTYSAEVFKKFILPIFEQTKTLKSCVDFFRKYNMRISTALFRRDFDLFPIESLVYYDEGFLFVKTDDEMIQNNLREILDSEKDKSGKEYQEVLEILSFFDEPDVHEKVLQELERRKKANIERLRAYGVIM